MIVARAKLFRFGLLVAGLLILGGAVSVYIGATLKTQAMDEGDLEIFRIYQKDPKLQDTQPFEAYHSKGWVS